MTDREQLVREEARIKVGDQWFYRGNRSPTWLFLAERLDGSPCGISEKVPVDWYPLLEEIARLLSLLPKEGEVVSDEMLNFLHGIGPLNGVHFGEKPEGERGQYWWRKHLPNARPK